MAVVLLLHITAVSGFESSTRLLPVQRWGGSLVPAGGRLRRASVGGSGVAVRPGASGGIQALRGAGGDDEGGGVARGGRQEVLVLFDIDGTLTAPRRPVEARILEALELLREKATIGFVGGSDLRKAREQLGDDLLQRFDYAFPENGLQAYYQGELIGSKDIAAHLGEDRLQRLLNWTLRYIADVRIPVKRGTFVEFRTGMLNISPIGRNCSPKERDDFEVYDKEHGVRGAMISAMQTEFADYDLAFSVGGQISFDVFPKGWDKTFCLQYLEPRNFSEIHFFGDKVDEGGNDHEIFHDPRTIGHRVAGPHDTIAILKKEFRIMCEVHVGDIY
eukprot:Tamp_22199.p1 GENE.Tamp_22199~~Tamp_22199.p1  ORF type:complete len:341 (+),score=46.65 Tamp_22199:30-1025(+)